MNENQNINMAELNELFKKWNRLNGFEKNAFSLIVQNRYTHYGKTLILESVLDFVETCEHYGIRDASKIADEIWGKIR